MGLQRKAVLPKKCTCKETQRRKASFGMVAALSTRRGCPEVQRPLESPSRAELEESAVLYGRSSSS